MSRRCRWPASETLNITGSQLIFHFVGAFFLAQAFRLYKQEAREVLVQPQYGTDRIFGCLFLG
jgi:hypothetical protein